MTLTPAPTMAMATSTWMLKVGTDHQRDFTMNLVHMCRIMTFMQHAGRPLCVLFGGLP